MPRDGHSKLKWQHVAGDCRVLSEILQDKDNKSPWLLFKFLDALLRGYGQVLFCNNPLTGALFLGALAVADWQVCLWGLLAACVGLIVSVILRQDMAAVRAGATTFNPLLLGLVSASALRALYGTPLEDNPRVAVIVVGAAALCVLVASGETRILSHVGGVPSLALPFVTMQALLFLVVAHSGLMMHTSDNGWGLAPPDTTTTTTTMMVTHAQVSASPTFHSARPVIPIDESSRAATAFTNTTAAQIISRATSALPRDVEIVQVPGAALRKNSSSESISFDRIRRHRPIRSISRAENYPLHENEYGSGTSPLPETTDGSVESLAGMESTTVEDYAYTTDVLFSLTTTDMGDSITREEEGNFHEGGLLERLFMMDDLMLNDGTFQDSQYTTDSDMQWSTSAENLNYTTVEFTTPSVIKREELDGEHAVPVQVMPQNVGEISATYHNNESSEVKETSASGVSSVLPIGRLKSKSAVSGRHGESSSGSRASEESMVAAESKSAVASSLGEDGIVSAPESLPLSGTEEPVDGEEAPSASPGDVDWGRVFGSILLGPTQAFGLQNEVAGALMYLGVALSSPVTAAALAAGAVAGAFTALLVGAPLAGVYSAAWTFNAMLTHAALCGFLFVWSPLSQAVALAATIFSVVLFSAVEPIMSSVPMPVMSLPFNLTTMLFYSVASRALRRPQGICCPEQHFRDYRADRKRRRQEAERQRMMDEEPIKEKKAPLAEAERVSDAEEV